MSNPTPPDDARGLPGGWTQAWPPTPSPGVQATLEQMSTQLQTLIGAAERAAEAIRLDAERRAQEHLLEAQRKADRTTAERVRLISELTDDLVRHAEAVRDRSEAMLQTLEEAIAGVAGSLEQPHPDIQQAPPPPPARELAPVPRDVLVHATRLAVGGSDREAISRSLRLEFGLANPEPVVDRVLGSTA